MAATDTVVLTDYSNFIKEWYIPIMEEAAKRLNPFLDETVVKLDHEHIAGQNAYWPVEFPSGAGGGSIIENAKTPVADAGKYQRGNISLKTHLQVIQISWQLMKQSEGERAAFNPAVATITKTAMDNWLRNLNRMFLGNTDGKLAQVDVTVSGFNITVDNAWGIDNTKAGSEANGLLFLFPNQMIEFFDTNAVRSGEGSPAEGPVRIASINTLGVGTVSAIITLGTTSSAIANGDYLHNAGSKHASDGTVYECDGLRTFIDDSDDNYAGIDTGSDNFPEWKSWVHYGSTSGTVEPLTRTRMNGPYNDIRQKSSGKPNLLFMGVDTEETYLELADSMQLTTNQKPLDVAGNWEGPTFRDMVLLSDPIYPETRMEYIDTSQLTVYQDSPADWIPGDIGILQKVANYLNWKAEYAWLMNFGCNDRTKMGSLRDIELISG